MLNQLTLPLKFLGMMIAQNLGPQRPERTPEPEAITDAPQNVMQYDQVMNTKLVLAYAAGLQMIHRVREPIEGGSAIDTACGPGHFTICLAKYLGYKHLLGIDLSAPMIEVATKNARENGLSDSAEFKVCDATRLDHIPTGTFDLATFTDAAHHLPDISMVRQILTEMDRVTKPNGLVILMDLARLRTKGVTEYYVKTLGADYVARGWPAFLDDFRNSMYAAWTTEELSQAIPHDSSRSWWHIQTRGLPTIQFIFGVQAQQRTPYVRKGLPGGAATYPIPADMRADWSMVQLTLMLGSKHLLKEGRLQ